MQNQTYQGQPVDMDAVNLAKSIRDSESGGNYEAKGGSGEHGAYQMLPAFFKSNAQKYLGDSNVPMSKENQDTIAYNFIKEHKDKGLQAGQIASLWNSGSPDHINDNHRGVNSQGVEYDTPRYVDKVMTNYQKYKQPTAQNFNPTPFSNPQEKTSPFIIDSSGNAPVEQPKEKDDSLGGKISGRIKDASTAITDTTSGKISPISGIVQTVGAAAGGLGDVVGKAIEFIPGVKKIEGLLGKGVGKLADTESGKAIIKGVGEFSKEHPELSKDIGAGFDIVTAIPILKGLGLAKNLVMDATSLALKGVAEKAAINDLTATASRTIGGRNALQKSPEALKTIINERAIPDISEGKYVTKEAYDKLAQNISHIEDTQLQPTLRSVSTTGVDTRQPIENIREQALKDVKAEFKTQGNVGEVEAKVNKIFDDYKKNYGDYVTLEDVNDMKRGIRKSVNFNSPKLDGDVSYHLGQVFQKNIEDSATKLGLSDINSINAEMGRLIKAQDMLKHIEGKPVKIGFTGGLIKDAATVGGEMTGNATGIPLAGAYIGREVGGRVGKGITGIKKGVLDRTGKDAVRTSLKETAKKTKGLITGVAAQKLNKN